MWLWGVKRFYSESQNHWSDSSLTHQRACWKVELILLFLSPHKDYLSTNPDNQMVVLHLESAAAALFWSAHICVCVCVWVLLSWKGLLFFRWLVCGRQTESLSLFSHLALRWGCGSTSQPISCQITTTACNTPSKDITLWTHTQPGRCAQSCEVVGSFLPRSFKMKINYPPLSLCSGWMLQQLFASQFSVLFITLQPISLAHASAFSRAHLCFTRVEAALPALDGHLIFDWSGD